MNLGSFQDNLKVSIISKSYWPVIWCLANIFLIFDEWGWIMATDAKKTIEGISVYVPIGATSRESRRLAPRLTTLRGARVGILDNCKEFADVVLRGVVEVLHREYGVAEIKFWRKAYLGIPSAYSQEMAAQCDAVINGVGH